VLILLEKLAGGFAKAVFALFTEEMHASGLNHASREERLRLGEISGASAFADSLAVDDFINVPDAPSKEQSRGSSRG
jgi:hypothetical protein